MQSNYNSWRKRDWGHAANNIVSDCYSSFQEYTYVPTCKYVPISRNDYICAYF